MGLVWVFPLSDWAKNLTMRIFYRACRNAAWKIGLFKLLTHHYITPHTLISPLSSITLLSTFLVIFEFIWMETSFSYFEVNDCFCIDKICLLSSWTLLRKTVYCTYFEYSCISLRGKNLFRRLVDLQKKATAAQRFCAPFHDQIKVLLA